MAAGAGPWADELTGAMVGLSPDPAPGLTFWAQVSRPAPNKGPTVGVSLETFARRNGVVWRPSPNGGVVARKELKVYLNETAPQWEDCELARLPTASTTYAPPLRGPGPARPLPSRRAAVLISALATQDGRLGPFLTA